MRGSLEQPPIVVRGKRLSKASLLMLIPVPLAFVCLLSLFRQPLSSASMWDDATTAFFVLLAGFGIWHFISPARLELSPDGIVFTTTWRRRRLAWAAARNFRPVLYYSSQAVAYDFGDARPGSSSHGLVKATTGADGLLATGMEIDEAQLSHLLNEARRHWAGGVADLVANARAETASRASPGNVAAAYVLALVGGRADRRLYWMGIGFSATVALVVWFVSRDPDTAGACAFIGAYPAAAARLRDLGRSPRWLSLAFVIVLPSIAIAIALHANIYLSLIAGALLPASCLVWLGVARGNPNPNKYGARPGWRADIER